VLCTTVVHSDTHTHTHTWAVLKVHCWFKFPLDLGLVFVCFLLFCSYVVTACSELRKVLFLAPSLWWFFVCVWNVSGTAERICAKFTRKTCLVPRLDELEGQGQGRQGQKGIFQPFQSPVCGFCFVEHLEPLVCFCCVRFVSSVVLGRKLANLFTVSFFLPLFQK